MLRILRAFAWLRWRMFVNSLERTGARDTLERLSIAIEQLGPIIAGVLLIPSGLALAALGAYAGYSLADGSGRSMAFEILRYLALAGTVLTIIGPIAMPGGERPNTVRLLLLPVPRAGLYLGQVVSALPDPWILVLLPALVSLPAGLVAGGAVGAAIFAAGAGLALTVVLSGLSALTTNVVHLLVRDRRRSELLALLFIVVLPAFAIVPAFLEAERERAEERGETVRPEPEIPDWIGRTASQAFALFPSELYVTATRESSLGGRRTASIATAGLALGGITIHVVGLLVFGRLLSSPATTGPRRFATGKSTWGLMVPGMSAGASAVALAQVRLALRTPRGRSVLISPLLVFVIFAFVMSRSGGNMEFGFLSLGSGLGLATFGSCLYLVSSLPFAFNQFAIDGSGLTLVLLSPLRESELLAGKAVGNAVIAGAPSLVCLALAAVLLPGGSLLLWLSIPLGIAATYMLAAPAAAALSILLPRAVDMNSIGRRSNAHGLAGFAALVIFGVAGLPPLALTLIATKLLDRPALTPALLLGWCLVTFALLRALFAAVARLFLARRENLGLVVK